MQATFAIAAALVVILFRQLPAQTDSTHNHAPVKTISADSTLTPATDSMSSGAPKLFLNCTGWCFEDYVKTELSFFNFVRDRFQADVQLLIIRQDTGSDGSLFTVNFLGQHQFQGMSDTLTFNLDQSASDEMIRSELAKVLQAGLVRFVAKTPLRSKMSFTFPKREQSAISSIKDVWDYWTFTIGANGNTSGESNNRFIWLNSFLTVRRITNENKIIANGFFRRNSSEFTIDGEQYFAATDSYGANALYAHSLSDHWSLGGLYIGEHSVFRNINFSHRIAPIIEYNVFPYTENTYRQLRISYEAGAQQLNYLEETVFSRMQELRPYQRLAVSLDLTQQWGTIYTGVKSTNFIDNFSQYRVTFDTQLSLRLAEGLSIQLYGSAALIQDQISLAKSDLNTTTVLLQGRQLPTSFSYWAYFGINYTFGSIYNSIVNTRFNGLTEQQN